MNPVFRKISVIGLGYIGLPTAAVIASQKIKVVGVDINPDTVLKINAGEIPIVEPDLDHLVQGVVNAGYLYATHFVEPAEVFLITVPTPFKNNYEPDLSYVRAAVQSIAPVLKKGDLVILESTSPVGTTEQVSEQLASLRADLIFPHQNVENPEVNIAYCPERVMPGKILRELVENDRIIGGMTPLCASKAKALYQLFVKGNCLTTNAKTAEMTKLTENAFRDVNIAFANELSMICERLTIDVWELIRLANHHPRVNILQPGPGVGGHCIAVDPRFIVHAAPKESKLIRAAREVNDEKPKFIVEKIKAVAEALSTPVIACFGLAYKADTDDLRESPAVEIIQLLAQRESHYHFLIVEPNIMKLPSGFLSDERFKLVSIEEALKSANMIVLLVNHKEFHVLKEVKFSDHQFFINFVTETKIMENTSIQFQSNEHAACLA